MTKKLIIGLSGLAGSGKDFVANLLVEKHGFVKIALADPLKRICQEVFDFSYEQLWGGSEERNKPDKRYIHKQYTNHTYTIDGRWCTQCRSKAGSSEPCIEFLTPRFALQSLGTEWGRNCYSEVWTDYTLRVAKKLLSGLNNECVHIGSWQYDPRHGVGGFEECSPVPQGVVISDVRFRNEAEVVRAENGKVVRIKREKSTTLSGSASRHSSEQEQKEILDSEFDYILQNQENVAALQEEIQEMLVKLSV